jgi:exportin-1
MEQAAAALLDFSKPFECSLLDQIVAIANDGAHPNRSSADEFLVKLRENPEIWKRTFDVLETSQQMTTKYFIIQALCHMVNTRWNLLPAEQKQTLKTYIVSKILAMSATDELLKEHGNFLTGSMNMALVQILKQDWPHDWPDFISDIVASSKQSESLCENNMRILRLLSEEVFDFSLETLTAAKIKSMKVSLNEEFSAVYHLCQLVIENSQKTSLVLSTLQTLQRFLTWIPLGYIFETNLLPNLLRFLSAPAFRTTVLDCLTEVASLPPNEIPDGYRPTLVAVLVQMMESLIVILPTQVDLSAAYERGSDEEQLFVQRLALFLSTFLKSFLPFLEVFQSTESQSPAIIHAVDLALEYLLRISKIRSEDDEVFKTTLEFWQHFAKELYTSEIQKGFLRDGGGAANAYGATVFSGLHGSGGVGTGLGASGVGVSPIQRRFARLLQELRVIMIDHMAKPEEVIVVENDDGEIVREMNPNLEVIAQYKTMREAIVLLTNLDYDDTEKILLEKLDLQVSRDKFTWIGLNTLCWAIGSISGAMSESDEKRFLVIVIKDLLRLCENEKKKDDKAVVASNIMYIVGQYPRFLRAHWKFLKTVVNKLFEFMHETHPGVQDMACDTFLKIAQKCKRKFMTPQTENPEPFIMTLISELHLHTVDLQPHQVLSFYESVGTMLSDYGAAITLSRPDTCLALMELKNQQWRSVMTAATSNVSVLSDPNMIKILTATVKVNIRVCSSAETIYVHQLKCIFLDLMNLNSYYSKQINLAVQQQGPLAVKKHEYKIMRELKGAIIDLMIAFFTVCKEGHDKSAMSDPDLQPPVVLRTFMPKLMDEILIDYKNSPGCARDSKVLSLFATAISTFQSHLQPEVPRIMESIFESTLEVITANMLDHPDHRVRFFKFIQNANEHCFLGLFSIPPGHQKMLIDSIVWAVKHTDRTISETGLEILQDLLTNVSGAATTAGEEGANFAQEFYKSFLVAIIEDVLGVMTGRLHKSGFKLQATILMNLFHLVQAGRVRAPIFDIVQQPNFPDNVSYLKEYVGHQVLQAFPNLSTGQVIAFINGCFDQSLDINAFKQHLRDFLINVKEYAAGDRNDDLYDEENKLQQEQVSDELRAYQKSVPGLLKPSEIEETEF